MSAVSNSVTPRSIALWITLREVSRSVRWPKLLQPRPTAETRRPEPPRLRICMDCPVRCGREVGSHRDAWALRPQGAGRHRTVRVRLVGDAVAAVRGPARAEFAQAALREAPPRSCAAPIFRR